MSIYTHGIDLMNDNYSNNDITIQLFHLLWWWGSDRTDTGQPSPCTWGQTKLDYQLGSAANSEQEEIKQQNSITNTPVPIYAGLARGLALSKD